MTSASGTSPPSGSPPRETTTLWRSLAPKLALSLVLGALFAFLVSRGGVPLLPPAEAFAHVRWELVALYVLILLATHFFRASRWRFLAAPIKDVPFAESVFINWIGFFAIFALPLRLGEFARPALSKMRQGIAVSVGLGTVAVERVLDGLVTSLCVVWGLAFLPRLASEDPVVESLPYYGWMAVALFTAALSGLVLFLWQRELAVKLIELTFGLVSKKLASNVAGKVSGIADGVRSIAHLRLAAGFVGETLLYWALNAFGMWVLAIGCGLDLGLGQAFAVMGILAIGVLLPAGPGMFGNFQLAISVALKLFFPESTVATQGAVYILLLYVVQASLITLAGVLPLYAMNLRLRDLVRTEPAS
ncbi:MAG: flippase-like domain-containing protein [Sandaracinaceae bacterium]|nr:flippase-like domain-containing protein [Sandaracinaceae bacterium]